MKKIILFLGLLILLVAFVVGDVVQMSVTVLPSPLDSKITVCSFGCDYTTIQDAVDSAVLNDTIYVHNGVYSSVEFFDKNQVSIIGQSKSGVKLIGNFTVPGVWINESEHISLMNLTILNFYQGIYVENSHNCSFDKIVSYNNTLSGMYLTNSNYNNITYSNFSYNTNHDGLSIDLSDFNIVDNNHFNYNNVSGIYVNPGVNNTFTDNIIKGNRYGIYYPTVESFDNDMISGNPQMNEVCDRYYYGDDVCYDYTAPSTIIDLVAYPGQGQEEIVLNWTAVGDNYKYGTAASYVLKYSLYSINSSNWDSATIKSQSWTPLSNSSLESHSIIMPVNDTYWFALRAVDDSNLSSDVSNSVSSLSPWHNVDIINMSCVKDLMNLQNY
jgi:parallel beta-helix repeat protein